jgi:hypothetical protein
MTGCLTNTTSSITESACNTYTSPSGVIYTTSGIYTDVILNSVGCDSIITIDLSVIAIDSTISQNGVDLTVGQSGATYQWLDCDNSNAPITGETNQTFTAQNTGNYAVEITYNGCVSTSSCTYVDMTGVLSEAWKGMEYYPNPVSDHLMLKLPNLKKDLEVSIMDIRSRIIQKESFSNIKNINLDVSDLSVGVYILRLKSEGESVDLKIIKK